MSILPTPPCSPNPLDHFFLPTQTGGDVNVNTVTPGSPILPRGLDTTWRRRCSRKARFKRIYNHLNPFPYDGFIFRSA